MTAPAVKQEGRHAPFDEPGWSLVKRDITKLFRAVGAVPVDLGGFPQGLKDLTAAEIEQLQNINLKTISNTQWGYVGAMDQSLTIGSSVEFAQVTHTGTGKAIFNAATEYWASDSVGTLDGHAATSVDVHTPTLNVNPSSGAATIKASTGGGAGDDAILQLKRSGSDWTFTADGSGNLVFAYPSTEAFRVDADGDILMAGTNQVQFGDAGTFIQQSANGILAIEADGEITYTAPVHSFDTLIDLVATTATAGQITQGGTRVLHTYGGTNIFVGLGAGNVTSIGAVGNVGIGYETLDSLTGGDYDTSVGYHAGKDITSGHHNVLIGAFTGRDITTGEYNTFIGVTAGLRSSGATSRSVMIGAYAGYEERASYKFYVDSILRASEAAGRVDSLIYGVFNAAVDDQLLRFNAPVEMLAGQVVDQVTKTGAYTATAGDYVILCDTDTAGAAFTITLPAAASHAGRVYYIKNTGTTAFDVTVDANGAETIDDELTQTVSDKACLAIVCDGTEWWII